MAVCPEDCVCVCVFMSIIQTGDAGTAVLNQEMGWHVASDAFGYDTLSVAWV